MATVTVKIETDSNATATRDDERTHTTHVPIPVPVPVPVPGSGHVRVGVPHRPKAKDRPRRLQPQRVIDIMAEEEKDTRTETHKETKHDSPACGATESIHHPLPLSLSSSSASASASSSAPPLLPFIFQPTSISPSESDRHKMQNIMEQRLETFLKGSKPIEETNQRQRNRMTKDLLLQRNIEIQALMFSHDRDYDLLLSTKPPGWELALESLDARNDALAEESDEIETLLFEKFRVVGGGRSLLADEIVYAGQVGASMAQAHRQRGMPMPTLANTAHQATTQTTNAPTDNITMDSQPKPHTLAPSSTADLIAPTATAEGDHSMGLDNAPASSAAAGGVSAVSTPIPILPPLVHPASSRSDAAMYARLDAAQAATRIRRAARKAEAETSLLGRYMKHFEQWIDVDHQTISERRGRTTKRKGATSNSRPAMFTLYLGTLVFPIYTDQDGIRSYVENEEEEPNSESKSNLHVDDVKVKSEHDAASLSSVPTAPSDIAIPNSTNPHTPTSFHPSSSSLSPSQSASPARGIKRPHSAIGEERKEQGGDDDEQGDYDDDEEEEEDEGDDHADDDADSPPLIGEHVWLDFTHDPVYIDGCIVKRVRMRDESTDRKDNADGGEDVVIGILPLKGLHPAQDDDDDDEPADSTEVDENGETIPKRYRPRVMPDPHHALAALYILHDAGVVRLESTLVNHHEPSPSPSSNDAPSSSSHSDCRSRVEVSVLVNSRIYDTLLLRSIAQREAMRTLFRMFATNEEEEEDGEDADTGADGTHSSLSRPVYANRHGEMVPYADLDDADRRMIAFIDTDDDGTPIPQSAHSNLHPSIKQEEDENGVAAMEIDGEEPKPTVTRSPQPSSEHAPSPSNPTPVIERTDNNKRRKIESTSLSLVDRTLDGDDIGASEDDIDEDDDDDDEYGSDDSDEDLLDTLNDDRYVFVDLNLPTIDDAGITIKVEPIDSNSLLAPAPDSSPPTGESNQVTEDEIASYKAIERASAEIDASAIGDKPNAASPSSSDDAFLERENKSIWRPDTLHALFESIRPTPNWKKSVSQPTNLIATLRPFQQKALAWLLYRESDRKDEYEDPLWESATLNGRTVYYHPFSGVIQREPPPIREDVRGGIFADEMGLGKTVVSIALIAKAPMTTTDDQHTHTNRNKRETETVIDGAAEPTPALPRIGATLIVSPMSLVYQWQKEIHLHAPSLRVMIYDGTRQVKTPDEADALFESTMNEFAQADIILTNYAVLGSEVNYSKSCHYSFRGAKQYAIPKSPLLDCHFHRVLLDEAQMVHSSLSVCFKMASRLSSTSRFCVSGTPIGPQGLHDLYGLVSFLGFKEYASVNVWRACMRTTTPDGLEHLRSLLHRIMWRHSKVHVLEEVCIPRLQVAKIYLNFSKVESEYYRRLEHDCQSNVFFESTKGRIEDRTAMSKLESLRQACAHPQAGSTNFLGKEIQSIPDIGKMLVKRVTDEVAACERDLARAMNKLAIEYKQQGQLELAEQTFVESWKIADSGVTTEEQAAGSGGNASAAASTSLQRGSTSAMASAASALTSSSTTLDQFESDTNIVTANTQVRQWRIIELVSTYQLASIYRQQLKDQFNHDLPPLDLVWRETPTQMFDRVMAETLLKIPALMAGNSSSSSLSARQLAEHAAAEAERTSKMLPPQLMAATHAAAPSTTINIDIADGSIESNDPFQILLKKFHQQHDQFKYNLHDLFDLLEENIAKSAILIEMDYEADLLTKCLATCGSPEVLELADDRHRVGIVEFNRLSQPYIGKIEELIPMLESEKETHETVLTLYDLSRSKLLIEEFQIRLNDSRRRHCHDAVIVELKSLLKTKLSRETYYPQIIRKVTKRKENVLSMSKKERPQRTLEQQFSRQLQLLNQAMKKRLTKTLTSDLRQQLESEKDMTGTDLKLCSHYDKYDLAWHRTRDSIQALRIMKEIKLQRSKMRNYITKMLQLRIGLLRDQGIMTSSEANEMMKRITEDISIEDEEAPDGTMWNSENKTKAKASSKTKKKKHVHFQHNQIESSEADVRMDDAEVEAHDIPGSNNAAPASSSSAAASSSSSSRVYVDTDATIDHDRLRDGAIQHLKRDITMLQTRAKAMHTNEKWLKNQFGLLSSDASTAVRSHVCSICKNLISQPSLTVCGHYFDASCLAQWIQRKSQPTCPDCRRILGPEDYAEFSAGELPNPIRYDTTNQEETSTTLESTLQRSSSQHAAVSSLIVPASAVSSSSSAAPLSSDLVGHPLSGVPSSAGDSSSSSSSSLSLPPLADVLRTRIVGEGVVGSKIEAICKYIKYLHRADPTVKVLVFSQYHRMLDMVGSALKSNEIHSLHLSGTPLQRARQIDRFQTDPTITAFLMSLRTDNSGLTLVDARAVFLMEPSLNPAIEAQAINRVHRIGQTRETQVFKFLMRHSVEQAIDELTMSETNEQRQNTNTNTTHTGEMEGVNIPTDGEALIHRSKESLSVSQLLTVLHLADDNTGSANE